MNSTSPHLDRYSCIACGWFEVRLTSTGLVLCGYCGNRAWLYTVIKQSSTTSRKD